MKTRTSYTFESGLAGVLSAAGVLAVLPLVGCGGGGVAEPPAAPTAAPKVAACARRNPGVGPARLDGAREGSTIALARTGKQTVAYIADEDARVVRTVDVATRSQLASTPLAAAPSRMLVTADGRVVVALRDAASVQVLEPSADAAAPLTSLCTIATAPEPFDVAMTPDDATLLVTSGWGASLTALDSADLSPRWRVALPREPRGVVVSDDGKKAYVAHVVGSRMSVVDLASPAHPVKNVELVGTEKGFRSRGIVRSLLLGSGETEIERRACQGFALAKTVEPGGRILAPEVLVDPGDAEQPAGGYGSGGMNPVEVANVAVVDDATDRPLPASLHVGADPRDFRSRRGNTACLLPRASVVDGQRQVLMVACLGIDAVVEYDAAAAAPHQAQLRTVPVGAGPTGIALDGKGRAAYVWSQFDRSLSAVPLDAPNGAGAAVATSKLPAVGGEDEQLVVGRRLFHTTTDPQISNDGRACASCHPDGRDDSLTWATPDGPRNTPMLAGRLVDAAPFGWNGAGKDVKEHLGHTFQRLGGRGLDAIQLDALIAYVGKLRTPEGTTARRSDAMVARGREVFHSAQAACASCHVDGASTDHQLHDIGSRAKADAAPTFDTPSLRFVGGTAPYFHDGRYATLRALLVDTSGDMGHTKHLSEADMGALEAYLRTL